MGEREGVIVSRDWKWEYENLCKFASKFQKERDALKQENAELREKLIRFEAISDNALFIMEKRMLALQSKLNKAKAALEKIISVSGTSTEHWLIAYEAHKDIE